MDNNQICLPLGSRYEPSSPSTEELHDWPGSKIGIHSKETYWNMRNGQQIKSSIEFFIQFIFFTRPIMQNIVYQTHFDHNKHFLLALVDIPNGFN